MRAAHAAGESRHHIIFPPLSKEVAAINQHLKRLEAPRFNGSDRPAPPQLDLKPHEGHHPVDPELTKRRALLRSAAAGNATAIATLQDTYHLTRWIQNGRLIFDPDDTNGRRARYQRRRRPRRRSRNAR